MVRTPGGAHRRVRDVHCMRESGHLEDGGDNEQEFYATGTHTFGVSYEKGRWVTR